MLATDWMWAKSTKHLLKCHFMVAYAHLLATIVSFVFIRNRSFEFSESCLKSSEFGQIAWNWLSVQSGG